MVCGSAPFISVQADILPSSTTVERTARTAATHTVAVVVVSAEEVGSRQDHRDFLAYLLQSHQSRLCCASLKTESTLSKHFMAYWDLVPAN